MILVTGAAGLLGHHLSMTLHGRGVAVRAFDYQKPPALPCEVEVITGDVRDRNTVMEAMRDVSTVYHLAAIMHVGKFSLDVAESVNVGGLVNVLECAAEAGARRVVFSSSIEIYGTAPEVPCTEDAAKNPPPGYPEQKMRGEKICLEFMERTGVETAMTRMPMILGPGFYHFKPMLAVFECIRLGLPLIVADGGTKKGMFVGVRDAIDGMILVGTRPEAAGEAFNICGPDVFTHKEVLEGLAKRVKSPSRVIGVPSAIAVPLFEFLSKTGLAPVAPEHFYFALHDCVWPVDKAAEMLGYSPKTGSVTALYEAYAGWLSSRRAITARKNASEIISR